MVAQQGLTPIAPSRMGRGIGQVRPGMDRIHGTKVAHLGCRLVDALVPKELANCGPVHRVALPAEIAGRRSAGVPGPPSIRCGPGSLDHILLGSGPPRAHRVDQLARTRVDQLGRTEGGPACPNSAHVFRTHGVDLLTRTAGGLDSPSCDTPRWTW